jgi:hypothetical protein
MHATKYQLTPRSENRKTGRIPTTMTERSSCPSTCPLKNNGCYADAFPLRLHWDKVEKTGIKIDDLCAKIESLPAGQLWRHDVAGDLPRIGQNIDGLSLDKMVKANKGKRGFTYTHHDMNNRANRDLMRFANEEGFTINLSGNNLSHADELADLNIAPVVTVVAMDYERRNAKKEWTETLPEFRARIAKLPPLATPKGRKVSLCPATYLDTNCKECGICQKQRKAIVAFPAHGFRKRAATAIAKR